MNISSLLRVFKDMESKPGLVLCDIDGCCIDPEARIHHLIEEDDYDTYLEQHHTDVPIAAGTLVYALLMQVDSLKVVFVTARQESQRKITESQLLELFGTDARFDLWMRDDENGRHMDMADHELKLHLLEANGFQPSDVFLAFDDRPGIVEAYRNAGIVAYQTDTGY